MHRVSRLDGVLTYHDREQAHSYRLVNWIYKNAPQMIVGVSLLAMRPIQPTQIPLLSHPLAIDENSERWR
jgi:hypothetical protein